MLSPKIVTLLNDQVALEQFSSNLYLQMSSWCDHTGLQGCASFLKAHAAEELVHMHKLFEYLNETGAKVLLQTIKAPPSDFKDLAEIFEKVYEHEIFITKSINGILAASLDEKDFSTFKFLQWFSTEQHEEENLFKTILDKIKIIGMDGKGIYYLDKEIRKMAPSPAGNS